ncbi:ACT domain-containing protein ACR4-like, partial [Phalaenopsis equestris]|uniref:ACT domain-containing protein ACR4-like n=1 Tax=Phalaenopsis equestris TaxID=78828 RepID=UPI0009E243DE
MQIHGANRYGILLKIVQVMSDLDLIIFKSYISSDGGWFMNSFYVTNPQGHKVRDSNLIKYMQESLNFAQKQKISCGPTQAKISNGNIVTVDHCGSNCASLEITFFDRPGIFFEIVSLLFEHSYFVEACDLWTYNGHVACIIYINEQDTGRPITGEDRLDYLRKYVVSILEAQHVTGETFMVGIQSPLNCQIHVERRLHQLMKMYMDYDVKTLSLSIKCDQSILATTKDAKKKFGGVVEGNMVCLPQVLMEKWHDKDYLVLKVSSRDRPKLIFDVVCALTDLNYDIFHGSICSQDVVIVQEYFVRRTDGCTILNEIEKQNTLQSLIAAVEQRTSHGLKMEIRTFDSHDLLSNVCRALRNNNLSLNNMKLSKENGLAVGTFYITDASSSTNANDIDQQRLEAVRNEIGRDIFFEKNNDNNISSPAHRI